MRYQGLDVLSIWGNLMAERVYNASIGTMKLSETVAGKAAAVLMLQDEKQRLSLMLTQTGSHGLG